MRVTLGPIRLSDPSIDVEVSHVMNRDRGLLDRVGGVFSDSPTSEADLYGLATEIPASPCERAECGEERGAGPSQQPVCLMTVASISTSWSS